MIDLNTTNEWQHRCPETGLVLPWYTKSFLDELVTWDLKDKVVFEYGAGASTLWWASRCRAVYAVESNIEYLEAVREKVNDLRVYFACTKETYLKFITKPGILFDIVVIDGDPVEWRDDCIETALTYIKDGGVLICDNWQQKDVWESAYGLDLLSKFDKHIFKQDGHEFWQTALFTKT